MAWHAARVPQDPRPSLDAALDRLLRSLCQRCTALHALDARRVLCVGASAWGGAAASVRGLGDCARSVTVGGVVKHWELALRPAFFLGGTPTARLATLAHELLHLDPQNPGLLLEERRHRNRTHAAHEAQAREVASQWLAHGDPSLLDPLAHHGEVLLRHWRVRPILETSQRRFTGRDLYHQPVIMRTAKAHRSVWW